MGGLQEWCERWQERVSHVRQRARQERENVCAVTWISRPESYDEQDVDIHVHVRIGSGRETQDYCAVFHRAHVGTLEAAAGERSDVQALHTPHGGEQGWEAVLVAVVKVLKDGKVRPLPSVVRLRVLQGCPHGWRDFLGLPDLVGERVSEVFRAATDRKAGRCGVRRWVASDVHCEPVADVVKRGSQVVDALADRDVEINSGRRLKDADAKSILACLHITIRDQAAWVSFGPPVNERISRLQVLIRPAELRDVRRDGVSHALPLEADAEQAEEAADRTDPEGV